MRELPETVDTQARLPLFSTAALSPLHNLNRRLFEVLIDEWRRRSDVTPGIAVLGAKLAPLSDELLWRLARVPICWVDAEFLRPDAWSSAALRGRGDHSITESPLPRGRSLELAGLTFALASATAKASSDAARIMFGMHQAVADAFAGFSIETVHRLGQTRAHWVRPRWHQSPEDWQRMIATAEHAESSRLPPVSIRVFNRMLADLEPAT
ncbi:MAG: hypothetical protein JSR66_33180 [Proteobacteria bacterium]|nr:hypothetical protein [Pseudomonadota bacterium]